SVINQLMRNSIKRPGQVNQDHGQLLTALFPLLDQSAQRCNIFSCTWNRDTSSLSGMYLAGFFRSLRHDIGKVSNKTLGDLSQTHDIQHNMKSQHKAQHTSWKDR
ncbi:hypothetical protein WMY93_033675, partial [Mugilogobius chulae]